MAWESRWFRNIPNTQNALEAVWFQAAFVRENLHTEEPHCSRDLPDSVNTPRTRTNTATVPTWQRNKVLGEQCCFLSQECFCSPGLHVCLACDQGLVLAQMICNRCRHHPGILYDLGWVFPIPTLKGMRREHYLFQPQCKGPIGAIRPRGASKSLLFSVYLTPEKFLAALFKQDTELIFDSQIQRKQSNLFMILMIFKNLDGCWICILLIPSSN